MKTRGSFRKEKEIVKVLQELNHSGKLIIVEGLKDKHSLRESGIQNQVMTLSKKPIFQVVEDIAKVANEVVILTDFDKKGKELYGKLNSGLQKFGVKVDHYFREWLRKNTKLSHVEGLHSYIEHI
ncbi:MAG TPA: toprim domain-containing protein [Candidatus Nanoarchaeia archaeon]|nr:toprim domain-containing protein [Candidatus Nanoarchaeia archaeon]